MDTQTTHDAGVIISADEAAAQRVLAVVRAYLRGAGPAPLYLASPTGNAAATDILAAAAAELRDADRTDRLLVGTGSDFTLLWRDTLRRGLTPIVRRALAARRAILLDGVEALQGEPFAQRELARVATPDRLVVLAGREHPQQVAAWSPPLAAWLHTATTLCLHDGPCVTVADARTIVDLVADYYGLTGAMLRSRRRTGSVSQARQVAMALLREQGLTYDAVGRILGRDHTTVIYGHTRIRCRSASEPGMRDDLARLRRRVGAA